jgi:toxin CptA
MSIAVSALVRPSRAVCGLLRTCGLSLLAAAFAIAWGAPERFWFPCWQALGVGLAGSVLLATSMARSKMHRIDISGTGDLRVTVKQDVDVGSSGSAQGAAHDAAAMLLPGSIVWPLLIVLRYAVSGVPGQTLLIGRDSVDAAAWRALTVALAVMGRTAGRTAERTAGQAADAQTR